LGGLGILDQRRGLLVTVPALAKGHERLGIKPERACVRGIAGCFGTAPRSSSRARLAGRAVGGSPSIHAAPRYSRLSIVNEKQIIRAGIGVERRGLKSAQHSDELVRADWRPARLAGSGRCHCGLWKYPRGTRWHLCLWRSPLRPGPENPTALLVSRFFHKLATLSHFFHEWPGGIKVTKMRAKTCHSGMAARGHGLSDRQPNEINADRAQIGQCMQPHQEFLRFSTAWSATSQRVG
jgi:hypothetical protein